MDLPVQVDKMVEESLKCVSLLNIHGSPGIFMLSREIENEFWCSLMFFAPSMILNSVKSSEKFLLQNKTLRVL